MLNGLGRVVKLPLLLSQFCPSVRSSHKNFLARDAFIRTNHRATAMMFLCLSGTGVHCDHMVHFSTDLSLRLDSPTCTLTPKHVHLLPTVFFQFHLGKSMDVQTKRSIKRQ